MALAPSRMFRSHEKEEMQKAFAQQAVLIPQSRSWKCRAETSIAGKPMDESHDEGDRVLQYSEAYVNERWQSVFPTIITWPTFVAKDVFFTDR